MTFPVATHDVPMKIVYRVGKALEASGLSAVLRSSMEYSKEGSVQWPIKQSTAFREVVLAVATGGFSLLKYLRSRR